MPAFANQPHLSVRGFKAAIWTALIIVFAVGATAASATTFSGESAWVTGGNFAYEASYTGSFPNFNVYLDTNVGATGYSVEGITANYLIENSSLYAYTGSGGSDWSWSWVNTSVTQSTPQSGTVQFETPYASLGSSAEINCVFQVATSNWTTTTDPTVVTYYGRSYYVSPGGSDANPGTFASPWQTPQHAANVVGPGSTVYLESGTYAPFHVNVSGSASGGSVVFVNYPGQTATIDGTGWSAYYDEGLVEIQNESYVTIEGLNIQNGSSTSDTSSPVGIMVEGSGNHIQLLNNSIHNITNTAGSNGNAHGILIRGDSSSGDIDTITISGNAIYNLQTGWSESCTLAGDVTNFTVSNNTIHDNNNIGLDLQGGYGTSPLDDQARYGEVSGNTVYNCSTLNNPYYGVNSCAGLYVDGGTQIVEERNTIHNCDIGIACSSENPGKTSSYVTVRNNLIYDNATSGIKIGGYKSSGVGGTSDCTFVNNTLYQDDTNDWWIGEITIGWTASGNVFDNNIIAAASQNVFVKDIATDGDSVGTFDYNDYYSSGGASNSHWQWINQTSWTVGFGTWQSDSGQDAHSFYSNPDLNSPTTNFNLTGSSPALNAGNYGLGSSVYGMADFAGNARTKSGTIDIGAYED